MDARRRDHRELTRRRTEQDMSIAFGVFDHLDYSGAPLRDFYEDRLKLLEVYDRLGFYCYHVAEHHATPLGMAPSPSVYLSAVAQRTKRINFGPLVYTIPFYHPIRLIEEICMLDQMSGGRFQFGVGKGISPIETRYYGLDPDKTSKMMIEAFEVLLRGLQNRTLDYEGEFYRFSKVPMELEPLQKPHPPLWYGAGTLPSVERPASTGMSIVTNAPPGPTRALIDHYWKHYKGPAGRAKVGFTRHLVVADTDEAAQAIMRRGYRRWHASFIKLWNDHGISTVGVQYATEFDGEGMNGRAIAGSPQTVQRILQQQIDETGANYVLCRVAFGDLTFAEARRSAELFAERVMPHLRAVERVAAQ
jgi:alkanesulfonate monooxygenase SsuD/methylene tetrahydromethanopterin reductase-like flavin-dependent oxidoreductase (luciferase family)